VIPAPAGLLAYEGFDYSVGAGNLPGKSAGLGWGAAWANINGGGGSVQTGSLAAGTNSPNGYDAQSLGNALYMPNGQRDGRTLDTTPTGRFGAAGYVDGSGNIGADGTTLYFSFLQQPDGATKFYEFELHRGDLGDPGRIGGIGNDTGNPTVSLRTGGTQTIIGTGSTGVNLYVVRIDFKAGDDDVYVYQNPVSGTEPATPTLTKLAAGDMSFNGISLAAFDNGRTVKHDEIRFGKSWSDVVFGTSRRNLTWTGDGTANVWNFTAQNWSAGSGATAFVDGDPVSFDDSGSATPAVSIPANVATGSITATNETKNYTLGGAGTINVSGGLAKSGAGALTFTGAANFGATVVVNDGPVALNGTTSAGGGLEVDSGSVALGGTNSMAGLITTNGNVSITGPATISGAGSLVWMGNLTGASSAVNIENGGSLNMSGSLADSWVIGRDGGSATFTQNGGTVTYNPSNRAEAYIGASIPDSTVAEYQMKGGTLEMSNKNLQVALGPITANLTQTGGTINVQALNLGATLAAGAGTGVFTQTGGVLNLGAGGMATTGNYLISAGGGTIGATADWVSALDMELTGTEVFDSGTHAVTINGWLTGTGSLTKTGTGSLMLSGVNSYSGASLVSAGTLGGAGVGEASALTVASGAILAPGDPSIDAIGSFATKTATLGSGATLSIDIDSSFSIVDELTASGAINITGATLAVQELAGGVLPIGTSLTIIQAGTTLTGTFAGLAEAATLSAGANTYAIHYQGSRVILTTVAGNAYSSWAATHGLDGTPGKDPAFTADPDGDGVINGLEWILSGNPLSGDASALYTVTGNATTGLTLNFSRLEAAAASTTLTVQWSNNLSTWTDVPVTLAGGAGANGVVVTVNQTPTPDTVSVLIPASNAAGGKLFARLKATMP
jgi:autotransporter-associated beta strand protein